MVRNIDFGTWLSMRFPFKVQKISVDAGFSCPNRDGRLAYGGCTFCNNRAFTPSFVDPSDDIALQIEKGKAFYARKYPSMRYLVYFQSFSGTYAPLDQLQSLYERVLAIEGVVGVVIGTRPDCVSDEILDYLAELSRRTLVIVEYGIESANDETLHRVNRGHSFAQSRWAVEETHRRGILVGGHIILGLPGEDAAESLRQAPLISSLPLDFLKIHQLQVVRGTRLAEEYAANPFALYSAEEYADLLSRYLPMLRSDLILDRFVSQSPRHMVVAPCWGMKPFEFYRLLEKKLRGERSSAESE